MKKAVLYVFYAAPRTCARRVRLMRSLNPDVNFYGICTDRPENQRKYKAVFDELDDAWAFPYIDRYWHWHNLDRIIGAWFVKRGSELPFDRLLVLDWDVLLLGPVSNWTDPVGERNARFIQVYENKEPEQSMWTRSTNPGFMEFCSRFKEKKGRPPVLHNAYLFAYALPRRALEDCAQEVQEYSGYCEFRLPTLLHSHGYELENLPRPKDWYPFSNVNGRSISRKLIRQQMAQADGCRLFHPVYEPYQGSDLQLSPVDWFAEGCLYRTMFNSFRSFVKRHFIRRPSKKHAA
jgi:hypothetical protein